MIPAGPGTPPRHWASKRIMHLNTERSEEHTSELQSLMRISYAVFCLKKKHKEYRRIVTSNTPRRPQQPTKSQEHTVKRKNSDKKHTTISRHNYSVTPAQHHSY